MRRWRCCFLRPSPTAAPPLNGFFDIDALLRIGVFYPARSKVCVIRSYSKTRNFECLRVPSSPDPGPVISWPGWTWLPSRSPGSGSHSCVAHTLKYCKWGYLRRLETSLTPPLQALYCPWWLHQALGRKFPTLGLVRPCDLFYAVQVHFLRLVGEINFCIPLLSSLAKPTLPYKFLGPLIAGLFISCY